MTEFFKIINFDNVKGAVKPQKYRNLLSIIKKADIIVSDSGGVPKEAAFLGKKSIVIRDFIIWDELEEQKWATLITPENLDQTNGDDYFKSDEIYGGWATPLIRNIINKGTNCPNKPPFLIDSKISSRLAFTSLSRAGLPNFKVHSNTKFTKL